MTPRIRTLAGVPVRNTFLNYELLVPGHIFVTERLDWADKPNLNLDAEIKGLSGEQKVAMMSALRQILPPALKVPAVRSNTRGLTDRVKEFLAKVKELEISPFSAADCTDFDLKNDM